MGISTQQYRISIGVFNIHKYGKNRFNSMTRSIDKEISNHSRYSIVLMVTVSVLLVANSISTLSINVQNQAPQSRSSLYNSSLDSYSPASCQVLNHNFWAKITNGNGRKDGIKFCQWNAGGGFLINKQEELSNIIDEFRPHVFGITESSFKKKFFFVYFIANGSMSTSRMTPLIVLPHN